MDAHACDKLANNVKYKKPYQTISHAETQHRLEHKRYQTNQQQHQSIYRIKQREQTTLIASAQQINNTYKNFKQ
jgi:hypothetical protein